MREKTSLFMIVTNELDIKKTFSRLYDSTSVDKLREKIVHH